MKSKKFAVDFEDEKKIVNEILNDPEISELEEIIVGAWEEPWEISGQMIIDMFVENKDKFPKVKSLFIGDMGMEENEISWIIQGDYGELFKAYPDLESLTIKGGTELSLGNIKHDKLKKLEIITGGLPANIFDELSKSEIPNLEKLELYLGVEDYGFDGNIDDVNKILKKDLFPKLTTLGIMNSEIQDDIVKTILESDILPQLEELSISFGVLTDKGGQYLIDNKEKLTHLKTIDAHYNYLTEKMADKLGKEIGGKIIANENNEFEHWDDKAYGFPYYTE